MTVIPDGKRCYCGKKGCLDAYCSALNLSELVDGKLERFFESAGEKRPEDGKLMGFLYKFFGSSIE